ncbi:DUF6282 family protein [Paenibacillus humicola]|uniref:DUF6282 family protein n=1 Tax=Paenibacillus humicola TaxID=3110540 RepID=UPI00237AC8DF|nr:DUF6282 family protein [Paenibacillus humicola]
MPAGFRRRPDLRGAIDLHVHSGPDVRARAHDDVQLAAQAAELGAGAVVIKSHVVPTMDRACLAGLQVPGVRLFGSITLNPPVGGLNPHAVETALRLGASTVWLPTVYSAAHLRLEGKSGGVEVTAGGRIVPPLRDVLKLVAERDAILGTGHLSPEDIFAVVDAARSLGVNKIVVTHPESYAVGMSLADQRKIAESYGVLFERVCAQPDRRGGYVSNLGVNLRAIRELGCESTVLATDGGQPELPSWTEMMTETARYMAEHGLTQEEINGMMKRTPARLLGLPADASEET